MNKNLLIAGIPLYIILALIAFVLLEGRGEVDFLLGLMVIVGLVVLSSFMTSWTCYWMDKE